MPSSAARRDIVVTVPLNGTVVAPPAARADIGAPYRGPVAKVYASVGERAAETGTPEEAAPGTPRRRRRRRGGHGRSGQGTGAGAADQAPERADDGSPQAAESRKGRADRAPLSLAREPAPPVDSPEAEAEQPRPPRRRRRWK